MKLCQAKNLFFNQIVLIFDVNLESYIVLIPYYIGFYCKKIVFRQDTSGSRSIEADESEPAAVLTALEAIAQTLKQRVDQQQTWGQTLTLKVKYADYHLITRSKTTLAPIDSIDTILCLAEELLRLSDIGHKQVRLLGLALSNLQRRA